MKNIKKLKNLKKNIQKIKEKKIGKKTYLIHFILNNIRTSFNISNSHIIKNIPRLNYW